jgi:hypothetical protein
VQILAQRLKRDAVGLRESAQELDNLRTLIGFEVQSGIELIEQNNCGSVEGLAAAVLAI